MLRLEKESKGSGSNKESRSESILKANEEQVLNGVKKPKRTKMKHSESRLFQPRSTTVVQSKMGHNEP